MHAYRVSPFSQCSTSAIITGCKLCAFHIHQTLASAMRHTEADTEHVEQSGTVCITAVIWNVGQERTTVC